MRLFALSLFISLAVWMLFTWPLPRHVTSGIPATHTKVEETHVRYMIPGDHLQLLYYFWLFGDMMSGHTPWFYNLYEFNTGDDEERYDLTAYYFPFSLFYSVFAWMGGRAFGYNVSGFLSIWLTYFFTWLLLARYVRNPWIAGAFAMAGMALPYRWIALLGGSPTGFAMAWVPMMLYGLDRAVRDNDPWGGLLAGLAVVFSFTSDIHVFFFNVLVTPAWCVWAFVAREHFAWRAWRAYSRILIALLPAAVLILAVAWLSHVVHADLAETHMAEGRDLREVISFSPERKGLFTWADAGLSSQVYIGYTLPVLILIGFLLTVARFLRDPKSAWRPVLLLGLLVLGLAVIALLSLGPHGPPGGRIFLLVRHWIPPYIMIRQAGKIFSLMPPLLALGGALAISTWLDRVRSQRLAWFVILIPALLMLGEYQRRIEPTLSLLYKEQPAYAAVAEDAEKEGWVPHVLVVSLWPGDTHYASIYQYFVTLYRIRMINGYTPAVRHDYLEDVFMRFQTINQGWMTDEQADHLIARGIRYIVVHEDIFPEKVSPFPIAYTLKSFHDHPRMRFLKQSGPVWSFRILEDPEPRPEWMPEWNLFFPARHLEFEHARHENARIVRDPGAGNREYLHVSTPGEIVRMHDTPTPPAPDLHWKVRVRGSAELHHEVLIGGEAAIESRIRIEETDWHWIDLPIPLDTYGKVSLQLTLMEGEADLDMAILASGLWPMLKPGESISVRAPLFCHAGHMHENRRRLVFRERHDRSGLMFYGPKLPFERGVYDIEVDITSDAPDGIQLGWVHIEHDWNTGAGKSVDVIAGQPVRGTLTQTENLPFNVVFIFSARADMELHRLTFTRIE